MDSKFIMTFSITIGILAIMYFGYNPVLDLKVNDFLKNGSYSTERLWNRDSTMFWATEQSKNYSISFHYDKFIEFKQKETVQFKILDREGDRIWISKNDILIDTHISNKTYNDLLLFFKTKHNIK